MFTYNIYILASPQSVMTTEISYQDKIICELDNDILKIYRVKIKMIGKVVNELEIELYFYELWQISIYVVENVLIHKN